jgi:hypothetical protein
MLNSRLNFFSNFLKLTGNVTALRRAAARTQQPPVGTDWLLLHQQHSAEERTGVNPVCSRLAETFYQRLYTFEKDFYERDIQHNPCRESCCYREKTIVCSLRRERDHASNRSRHSGKQSQSKCNPNFFHSMSLLWANVIGDMRHDAYLGRRDIFSTPPLQSSITPLFLIPLWGRGS